jgi:hypothetical protein
MPPTFMNDLLKDLFDHRNPIMGTVRNFQVSHPCRKVLLSILDCIGRKRENRENLCRATGMTFASNPANYGVSGTAVQRLRR